MKGSTSNPMQTQIGVPEVARDKPVDNMELSLGHLRGHTDQVTSKVLGIRAIPGIKDAEWGFVGTEFKRGLRKEGMGTLQKA